MSAYWCRLVSTVRARAVVRILALCAPVLVAACLGKRGAALRPAPVAPPVVARQDTAVPIPVPRPPDSALVASRDSLVRVTDSLQRVASDSAKPVAVPRPSRPAASKPGKQCLLDTDDSPPTARFSYQQQNDSSSVVLVGGGFVGHCVGEKNVLKADSAEFFELNGFFNLYGNVTYEERNEFRVTANHATYFIREGKLYADGNVNAIQIKSGSIFTGPTIEYFRVMPDVRSTSRMYAPNNPVVQIQQKDSAGKELPPVRISANIMQDNGDSLLNAWGSVTILRSDIRGSSDSARFDKPTGEARLIRGASIQSTETKEPFVLSGDTIDLFARDQVLERVLATHLARAKSGEVTMSAERLDLRVVERKINRAFAFGTGRAKADTKDQTLEADSMDILLPDQRVQELRAHGAAVAISKPDTLRIRSDELDVLRGDTIIAKFDSLRTAEDTATRTVIRTITAGGNASSKVQVASRQGPSFPPAINYIRGKHLVVTFDSGQVREIAVDSSASGSFFEPMVDSLADSSVRIRPRRPPPLLETATLRCPPRTPSMPSPTCRYGSATVAMLTRTYRVR